MGNRGRRRFVDFLVPDGNSGLFQGNVGRFGHGAQAPFHQQKNRGFRICNGAIWLLATLLLVIAGAFAASRAGEAGAAVFMKSALVMIGAQFAASLLSGIYARKQLGGMSGDIAGFMLVWSELAAVFALAVI